MKKLLMAVAAFGMLLTSCAKDDTVAPVEDKEALVSFCVNSPAVATRYGEGETAQDLYYAVYDTQEGYVAGLSKVDGSVEIKTSTTVNLNLVQGRTYEVIFWAQAEGAPYTLAWGDVVADATMTYNPQVTLTANNEAYDAFYAHVESFEVKGAVSQTVELKRPFAQLNVATADTALASTAGVDIATTGVEVKGVYTTLNLANDTVDGETTLTFAPTTKANGKISANGKEYDHIAMNYLLVNDKKLVDVTLTLAENNNTAALTRNYTSVPVQRNYRTNIIGNILTSTADFNVEIKPGFVDEDVPFTGADALRLAAIEGGEYTLEEDIVADGPIAVPAGVKFELNLNGKKITANNEKGEGAIIENAGTLSITGGTLENATENGDAVINNTGELVLSNVTIKGAPIADGEYPEYTILNDGNLTIEEGTEVVSDRGCLRLNSNGATVINGGSFTNVDIGTRSLTSHVVYNEKTSNHKLTINGGTFQHLHTNTSGGVVICNRSKATTEINGGSFSGGNYYGDDNLSDYGQNNTPTPFAVKGGTFSVKPKAKFLVDGYKAMEKDGKYVVVPEEVDAIASNNTELAAAIADNATIVLAAGTYIIPDEAKGKTLTIQGTGNPEDVVLAAQDDGGSEGDCDYSFDGATVTFDGVTITTTSTYFPGYARMKGTYNNCIINGVYTTYDSSSFTDCTFNVSGDVYNLWTWGAETVELTNCTFNCDGKAVLLYGTANTKLTVNNCKFNDNGSISGKAAIETGNDYNKSYELTVNNTTVNGFDINPNGYNTGTTLWANKNSMSPENLKVTVDGKDAYKVVVADAAGLNSAIAAGVSTIGLTAGTYDLPITGSKTLTFTGTGNPEDVVVNVLPSGSQNTTGTTLVFEGVTIQGATENYRGFFHTNGCSFKDCIIKDKLTLYSETSFENCSFTTTTEHCVWTYGSAKVSFKDCEFTYGDRCVNVYSENGGDMSIAVSFDDCEFIATDAGSKGAVEINSSAFPQGASVDFTGCTAPAKGHMVFISGWDSTNGATATVKIDGVVTTVPQGSI